MKQNHEYVWSIHCVMEKIKFLDFILNYMRGLLLILHYYLF
jgi:hypothetical protein